MSTPPPAGDNLHDRRLAEGRRMFVLAAATLERDVLLHELIEDEQNVLVGAVLNAADRIEALEAVRSTREGEIERLRGHFEALNEIIDRVIVVNDQADRVRWKGEWYDGPLATAYLTTLRAVQKLARQALNKGTDR